MTTARGSGITLLGDTNDERCRFSEYMHSATRTSAAVERPVRAMATAASVESLELGAAQMQRVARWASLLSVTGSEGLDHEGQEALASGVIVAYASAFARSVGPPTGALLDPDEWTPADPTYAELHGRLIDSLRRRYVLQNETDVPGDYGRRAGLSFLLDAPAATWQRISELANVQVGRMRELAAPA
jgi:hypothetical protein